MEVNLFGVVATSQAFIPLLRQGPQKGRILNISSVVRHITLHTADSGKQAGAACTRSSSCQCRKAESQAAAGIGAALQLEFVLPLNNSF